MYESGFGKTCCLEGIDFSYAIFGQCNFSGVNLSQAVFKNATLGEVSFRNVDLSYVDLSGVERFNEVSFKNVIFYETIMPDGSIYTDSI
ncbi:pentapeptide repeat-containing protein [Funiculus sociatus]